MMRQIPKLNQVAEGICADYEAFLQRVSPPSSVGNTPTDGEKIAASNLVVAYRLMIKAVRK